MTPNTRTERIAALRERDDRRIVDAVVAALDRDVRGGAFAHFDGTTEWPEIRLALHVRIRRAMLDAGLGRDTDQGIARVDSAVARSLDAFESTMTEVRP